MEGLSMEEVERLDNLEIQKLCDEILLSSGIFIRVKGMRFNSKFKSKNALGLWNSVHDRGIMCSIWIDGTKHEKQFLNWELYCMFCNISPREYNSNHQISRQGSVVGVGLEFGIPEKSGEYVVFGKGYYGLTVNKIKIDQELGVYQNWNFDKSAWKRAGKIAKMPKFMKYGFCFLNEDKFFIQNNRMKDACR